MTPLALSGRAGITGLSPTPGLRRDLYRLRRPRQHPEGDGSIDQHDIALVQNTREASAATESGYRALCTIGPEISIESRCPAMISLPKSVSYIDDGDVIALDHTTGAFRVLYRRSSRHNGFLVTDRCNHYCLMCSQPPKNVDDSWLLDELTELVPLISPETKSICFTGGEPFLEWQKFISLVGLCRSLLPDMTIQVLTNGRAFADSKIVDAWAKLHHPGAYVAIPIYAAVDYIHDYVVQAQGAFDETLLGVLKLKDRGLRVEIRVVLHRITAPIIAETCTWIARNLPFVDHVALMGMENVGFALANEAQLWIDPVDYRTELARALGILRASRINASVYNLPLCLLAPSARPHAARSISDWKNDYLPVCDTCPAKSDCAGFFSSGRPKVSRGVSPIRLDVAAVPIAASQGLELSADAMKLQL